MRDWILISAQTGIILSLLFGFYFWVRKQLTKERDEKRLHLNCIQERLSEIHYTLLDGETDMFGRQGLFTEMEELLEERRELLSA